MHMFPCIVSTTSLDIPYAVERLLLSADSFADERERNTSLSRLAAELQLLESSQEQQELFSTLSTMSKGALQTPNLNC